MKKESKFHKQGNFGRVWQAPERFNCLLGLKKIHANAEYFDNVEIIQLK